MKTWFVAGTDTDAGKTIVTTALRAYYQKYHSDLSIGLMKLLQTGDIGDQEFYQKFFDDVVVPLRFSAPLAPQVSAELEEKTIDLGIVWQQLLMLQKSKDLVLLEGLGGLGSPVTNELTVADIASNWRLETILVVPVKLGAIAHTVANVALARQEKVKLKGIIFNCLNPCSQEEIEQWTPKGLIESLTQVPVLGYFPYVEKINIDELADLVSENINV